MSDTVTELQRPVAPLKIKLQQSAQYDVEPAAANGVVRGKSPKANASAFQDKDLPPGIERDPELAQKEKEKFMNIPFQRPLSNNSGARQSTPKGNGLHTPTQLAESATSAALEPSEAGHARRWIKVPKGWYAKKGAEVVDGLHVGDALGKGCQVCTCITAVQALSPVHLKGTLSWLPRVVHCLLFRQCIADACSIPCSLNACSI